jgi:diketogulonate reductase-like aldo/keto reductase/flavodoxin
VKRIISLLLAGIMIFVLAACSNMTSNGETTTTNSTENEETMASETMEESKGTEMEQTSSKVLVAYFSNTGTTKNMAENAAEILNGDLFEIVAETPYTAEDLNYNNSSSRANIEQNDSSARPEIASNVDNMNEYDIVVIGYPIWHGQAPRIISTFLENYDFSGKTIIPFCTSHSSSIGNSDKALHELCSDKTNWIDGKRFAADSSKESMQEWLNGMNLQLYTQETETSLSVPVFNFDTKTVKLNSGYEMPINGLGTYSLTGEECVNAVTEALERGVRLIDTAYMYHNEAEVGQAIRNSSVPREDIFVITKLYPNQFANAETSIGEALEKLDIGYIDMLLLHHPGDGDVEAYQAMEKAVKDGKVRSIGLSNWYVEELESFLPQVTSTPALVQNEIHPYYQENDVIPYIQSLGIVTQGWYPLGGRGHTSELLGDEVILKIAEAHGKSSAQIILRWNLQKGVVVIPGSSNPEHIQENTELYDFELTDDEMNQINALDRNEKHDWY